MLWAKLTKIKTGQGASETLLLCTTSSCTAKVRRRVYTCLAVQGAPVVCLRWLAIWPCMLFAGAHAVARCHA